MQFGLISGEITDVKIIDTNHRAIKLNTANISIPEIGHDNYNNTIFLSIRNYVYGLEELTNVDESITEASLEDYDKKMTVLEKGKYVCVSNIKFRPTVIEKIVNHNLEKESVQIKNMCKSYINNVTFDYNRKMHMNVCSLRGKITKEIRHPAYTFAVNSRVDQIPVIIKNSKSKLEVGTSGLIIGSLVCFPENYGTNKGRHGIYGEFLIEDEDNRHQTA